MEFGETIVPHFRFFKDFVQAGSWQICCRKSLGSEPSIQMKLYPAHNSSGEHNALDNFCQIQHSIATRPTCLQELIPLPPKITGPHDALRIGSGGCLFPILLAVSRVPYNVAPVLWRVELPDKIRQKLVTDKNPNRSITNAELELAGSFLQKEAATQCFDIRERTVLSKTNSSGTLFWSRKGLTTISSVPTHILGLMSIHQQFHRYVPRFDYLPGK